MLQQHPAAEPGGHVIKSFDVRQKGSAVWAIYLTPAHCGTNLEMIKIIDAVKDVQNTSDNMTTYRPVNQTESMVTVTRVQRATPPVDGTFDLTFKGQRYSGKTLARLPVRLTLERKSEHGAFYVIPLAFQNNP